MWRERETGEGWCVCMVCFFVLFLERSSWSFDGRIVFMHVASFRRFRTSVRCVHSHSISTTCMSMRLSVSCRLPVVRPLAHVGDDAWCHRDGVFHGRRKVFHNRSRRGMHSCCCCDPRQGACFPQQAARSGAMYSMAAQVQRAPSWCWCWCWWGGLGGWGGVRRRRACLTPEIHGAFCPILRRFHTDTDCVAWLTFWKVKGRDGQNNPFLNVVQTQKMGPNAT